MKRLYILFILVFTSYSHSAEWEVLIDEIGSGPNIKDVYVSENGIWATGYTVDPLSSTYYFAPGETTYTKVDFTELSGHFFKSIHFFDSNTGIITGWTLDSKNFALGTTDGGATWTSLRYGDAGIAGFGEIEKINDETAYIGGFGQQQFKDGSIFKVNKNFEFEAINTYVQGKSLENIHFF